jgi:hypothetical protein
MSSAGNNVPVGEQCHEPLGRVHARLDTFPDEVVVEQRQDILEETVKLVQAQLETRHVG